MNSTDIWKARHTQAWLYPNATERPMVAMLKGWATYATQHQTAYESPIGEDYVLGPEWAKIGFALRGMLNGALDRLDGGTLDSFICDRLNAQGWDCDTEERKEVG